MPNARLALHTDHPMLTPVIDALYSAFYVSPLGDRVECWIDLCSEEYWQKLVAEGRSRMVRNLTEETFDHLSWHAMCWDRDHPETVWYFLPRLLDQQVASVFHRKVSEPQVKIEMLCEIIYGLDWRQWPNGRGVALEDAWRQIWRYATVEKRRERYGDSVTALLLAVGFEVAELRAELSRWSICEGADVMAEAVSDSVKGTGAIDTLDGWAEIWGNFGVTLERRLAMVEWFRDPATMELLEAGFFASTEPEQQARISEASQLLGTVSGW
jgi:hypothetical protein